MQYSTDKNNNPNFRLIQSAAFGLIASAIVAGCTYSTDELDAKKEHGLVSNEALVKALAIEVIQSARSPSVIKVAGSGLYRLNLTSDVKGSYATLSLFSGDKRLADNLNLPQSGLNQLNVLVDFTGGQSQPISFEVKDSDITIIDWSLQPVAGVDVPKFTDISELAGLDKVSSIKYGGPTVADLDQDGDFDFIVNNHNAETSKLYWNNSDGAVTKHHKNLARWFMHDLHGTAAGDYDNDGDLDLVVTMGGGNGTNPSKTNFYHNDKGNFVLYTGDVGIDRGGRGRGARWIDADLDGDLDLLLFNEASLTHSKPQHYFYQNLGNGKFAFKSVAGMQDVEPSRVLVTDINQDQIDDIIFYGHHAMSIWQGNGDFTYQNVTQQLPTDVRGFDDVMAMVDVDIDNDGDLDLYVARGKEFGVGKNVSMDFDALSLELDIKPKGTKGQEALSFTSGGELQFYNFHYQAQLGYRNKFYPMFLGENKSRQNIKEGGEFVIKPSQAQGFPTDLSENGMYFGITGKTANGEHQWQAALVRNGNVFWGFGFSLRGVTSVTPAFELENRNVSDALLENINGKFVDVSAKWNLPKGGNSLGATRGDFNNDGHQDLLVYRWGRIGKRIADLMLINNQQGQFESFTQHGANDIGGPGNGDMGQSFDFDLDGKIDLLSGSEGGEWYLFGNTTTKDNNHLTVRVGYSPKAHIDAYGAVVEIKVANKTFKQRVGSNGEIFSQSLLNNLHFGLGSDDDIRSVKVRWRNGETYEFSDVETNSLINTPESDWFKQTQVENSADKTPPATKPFIQFVDPEKFAQQGIKLGSPLKLSAQFDAGSGNKVIFADEGGVRFWLRQFKYKWVPAKDITKVDSSALYLSSGNAEATLTLTDVLPTSELPEGHFYQLRVSFMSSDGEMYDHTIDHINIFK